MWNGTMFVDLDWPLTRRACCALASTCYTRRVHQTWSFYL